MKLLVFAHTPPPHHGQSYMVQLMLQGFGGDRRRSGTGNGAGCSHAGHPGSREIACYHVNARLSSELADIGDLRIGKLFLLVGYCLQAIWCRFRYNAANLYYVPAPGKKSALLRDWLVMALCRPFFKRTILHWHASGLAKWLETSVQMRSRSLTFRFMQRADLSIVLSSYGRSDAEKLWPSRVSVVANGIPDPCPSFEQDLLNTRRARLEARRRLRAGRALSEDLRARCGGDPEILKIGFLGHCTQEKGLFDAIEGFLIANRRWEATGCPIALQMNIAGSFISREEKARFERIHHAAGSRIRYANFVSGQLKWDFYKNCDVLCFPSYIESFGLVLVEAMAVGLPVVATRAGAMPEVLPPGYAGLVDVGAPEQIASALLELSDAPIFEELRAHFRSRFILDRHLDNLSAALVSLEKR